MSAVPPLVCPWCEARCGHSCPDSATVVCRNGGFHEGQQTYLGPGLPGWVHGIEQPDTPAAARSAPPEHARARQRLETAGQKGGPRLETPAWEEEPAPQREWPKLHPAAMYGLPG